jgi:hypothetical protein
MNKNRFEGVVEPFNNKKPFYMVVVEGNHTPPKVKHESYNDAFDEAMRLCKKENKTTYVVSSVTQINLVPKILQYH